MKKKTKQQTDLDIGVLPCAGCPLQVSTRHAPSALMACSESTLPRTHQTYCCQVEPWMEGPNLRFCRFPACFSFIWTHPSPFCICCTGACPRLGNHTLGRRTGAHLHCLLSTQLRSLRTPAAKARQNIWLTCVLGREDPSLYIRDRL